MNLVWLLECLLFQACVVRTVLRILYASVSRLRAWSLFDVVDAQEQEDAANELVSNFS